MFKTLKVTRPWGSFIQFTHNDKNTVKILEIKPKEMLSLQSHKNRAEFWYIIEGNPTIVLNTKIKKYKPGDSIRVRKGVKHRIINKTNMKIRILEIAIGNFDEKDEIRYEDKYDRLK
jgi:mannose-6-phosphate isomerase-like protein (cupin superfamily)